MIHKFWCPRCGQALMLPGESTNGRAHCTRCGHGFDVPEPVPDTQAQASSASAEPAGYGLVEPAVIEPSRSDEPPPVRAEKPPRRSFLGALVGASAIEPSRLQGPSVCLVALSAADLFMTFTLLQKSHAFYESNPIAMWFFQRWDMAGMVGFKFAMIGGAIGLGEIIERKRPGLGKFVIYVGCAAALYAIWQGFQLYLGTIP
jgi:hypothetical protein